MTFAVNQANQLNNNSLAAKKFEEKYSVKINESTIRRWRE